MIPGSNHPRPLGLGPVARFQFDGGNTEHYTENATTFLNRQPPNATPSPVVRPAPPASPGFPQPPVASKPRPPQKEGWIDYIIPRRRLREAAESWNAPDASVGERVAAGLSVIGFGVELILLAAGAATVAAAGTGLVKLAGWRAAEAGVELTAQQIAERELPQLIDALGTHATRELTLAAHSSPQTLAGQLGRHFEAVTNAVIRAGNAAPTAEEVWAAIESRVGMLVNKPKQELLAEAFRHWWYKN
jgi:hypothetical protein